MKKSVGSKEPKTSKAAVTVRELPPKHEPEVRGGITVSRCEDIPSTA